MPLDSNVIRRHRVSGDADNQSGCKAVAAQPEPQHHPLGRRRCTASAVPNQKPKRRNQTQKTIA